MAITLLDQRGRAVVAIHKGVEGVTIDACGLTIHLDANEARELARWMAEQVDLYQPKSKERENER